MTPDTTYVRVNEEALRVLAQEGYDTQAQAAAFKCARETIRRRRREYGIAGPRERKQKR